MSNLIKQLGGYEECKRIRKVPGASSFRIRDIEFTRDELERAMLEYRRANNIFDFTDKVVFTDPRSADVICAVYNPLYLTAMAKIGSSGVRHATDEEIAAGKRL